MKAKPVVRRKPKGDRKEASVRIRMTESQKKAFDAAALKEGLELSGWMRSVAMRYIESKGA